MVKLNEAASIEWQIALGGTNQDQCYGDILETPDNGFVMSAMTNTTNNGDVSGFHGGGGADFWLVKVNSSGSLAWQKCLGGTGDDQAYGLDLTDDGGYVLTGTTLSNDGDVSGNHGGSGDVWVVKLDASRNIEWQRCLGGSGNETGWGIKQTNDGGYIMAAHSNSNDGDVSGNHGSYDFWVVKLNSSGTIEWQNSLGGAGVELAKHVVQLPDNGYVVVGKTDSNDTGDVAGHIGGDDYWVVKLNSSGTLEWQKCLGGSGNETAYYVDYSSATDVLLVNGESESTDWGGGLANKGGNDMVALILDPADGSMGEGADLGGSGTDRGFFFGVAADGDAVLFGDCASTNEAPAMSPGLYGDKDYWIIKF